VSYKVTIPVDFASPPQEVYEALSNLGPDWINGMTSVSPNGRRKLNRNLPPSA
jgi:hypothetical protein